MARVIVKKGDLFKLQVKHGFKVFQFMLEDKSCLDGDVIRVFKKKFSNEEEIKAEVLIDSDIMFYAHTSVRAGVKQAVWSKVKGMNIPYDEDDIPMFRTTSDGYAEVKTSYKWYVWKVNQERKFLGQLTDEYRGCPFGALYHPVDIGDWVKTGINDFNFPE